MEMDPFSPQFQDDPYPVYRHLRDEAPCYYNSEIDFYALTRYADLVDASQQPTLFSSAEGTTLERLDTGARTTDGARPADGAGRHTSGRRIKPSTW